MKEIHGKFGFEMKVGEFSFLLRKPRFSPIILMLVIGGMMGLAAIVISIISVI